MHAVVRRRVGLSGQFVELAADKASDVAQGRFLAGCGHAHADLMGVAAAVEPDGKPCSRHVCEAVEQAGARVGFSAGELGHEFKRHGAVVGEIRSGNRTNLVHGSTCELMPGGLVRMVNKA